MQQRLRKITISLLIVACFAASSALAAPTQDEPRDPISRVVRIIKSIIRGVLPIHSNDDSSLQPPLPH
jgi:glutamate racemase